MVEQVRLGIGVSSGVQRSGGEAEVEKAVEIVVEEDGAPSVPILPRFGHDTVIEARCGGYVGECPPVIVQQEGTAAIGIKIIQPTIAIVVAHGDAHAVAAIGHTYTPADFREPP